MSIYQKAVDRPVTTALVFVACMVFGIFSLINLSINQLPEFDSNYIMVISNYKGASAPDIETNLSKVLENTLNAVPNLKNLTSTSKEDISVISLEFEYGTDIEEATNDVRDKLDLINSYLPDGASLPVIFKFSADDMPIYIMSATAKQSYKALDKILDDKLATPLARISGVGTVSVQGAPKREIQVYVDPVKLKAYNLPISTISAAIAYENKNVPSGDIDMGSDTYNLRVEKEFKSSEEIKDIVVGYSGNKVIYVHDVAEVVDGLEERGQDAYTNGVKGARIMIQKQSGANTVDVLKKVKKELVKIQKTLPPDIEITTIIDGSRTIVNSIRSLVETIIITFLVVMAIVFLFLGRWRATFIILTAIPISLLASLVYLYATGNTLNVVSMSALSIAIGMVVDDAIVVLENVSAHIDRGEEPREAAVSATGEVGISVVASTLTMLAVFLPLTMIKGMAGIMFRQLGWIVSIIMIVSTCGALTLVPMMCSRMLRKNMEHGRAYKAFFGPFNEGVDRLKNWYGGIMEWSVNHRIAVLCAGLAIFVASLLLLGPRVKTEYMPKSDSGRLTATVELPVGTAQSVTAVLAAELYERWKKEMPEAMSISMSYGQADTDNAFANMQTTGTYLISYNIDVGSIEDRERGTGELADIMRADLATYPEIKKFNVTEGAMGMGGAPSIDLEIYGYDFGTTDQIMSALQGQLREEPCFAQILPSREDYIPSFQVNFDREKLALNGLNSTTAASYVTAAINGSTMSIYREDGDEYYIRVRYSPEWRTSIEDIENIDVYTPLGTSVKVSELATIEDMFTPPSIVRKNRERMVKLTCIVKDGYALSDCVEASQKVIDGMSIPPEISVTISGDYEEQQKSFKQLGTLLVLIIILVYMVMASQFESFMTPFVIMMAVPFTVTGVLLGLWMHNTPLGVMALIGVIILMGIVVKNGIVLLDFTIILRRRDGMELKKAVVTACKARLRPILMTSLTTILGMVPLAVGTGEGAELWRGLGVTVIWGLTISSLITLVLIPVMYTSFSQRQLDRLAKAHRKK